MKKKPDGFNHAGAIKFSGPVHDTGKPGIMAFEIRVLVKDDGNLRWFSGIQEGFVKAAMGESLEWRQKVLEQMLFMTEQTLSKGLGLTPQ